jgi:hypothetical protein
MEMQEFLDKIDTIRGLLEYPSLMEQIRTGEYLDESKRNQAMFLLNQLRTDADVILRESYEDGYEAGSIADSSVPWRY